MPKTMKTIILKCPVLKKILFNIAITINKSKNEITYSGNFEKKNLIAFSSIFITKIYLFL